MAPSGGPSYPLCSQAFEVISHDFGRATDNLIMPGVRGRQAREFLNWVSGWTILGVGLFGALIGSGFGGPGGAMVGFLVAVGILAHTMMKHRFLR